MDFLSAAQVVLERHGRPLHYKDIARHALDDGLITPTGMTPEATMGSRLYVDTKKDESRFERAGKGRFSLKKKTKRDDIAKRVEEINQQTRQILRKRLLEMPADRFEILISELLIAVGFEEPSVQVTSYSGDGGIDVRGVLNAGGVTSVNAAVQVKRWKKNVQTNVVRELRGSLTTHEQGIIITTSDYSAGARTEASAVGKVPISLLNGSELIDLLVKHSIGVNKEPHTVITLDEEWWNEANGDVVVEVVLPVEEIMERETLVEFPLTVRAMNSPHVVAMLFNRQGRMEFNHTQYGTPSSAGKVAPGWKSCNGWRYWQYQHPESKEWRIIDELRG
ncbi:MAG TPA: restriction endonuclease [Promineifilum sp.]|nr:restriction endonuclease [Promineifilum sp.]HRO23828.1 restriction endonuclease [Promineifilum sp.]HRO90956.1 restriction endonuclease [Promineifilum sp.]HRQ14103.1 restriction endonuclease [Promineifilum sp.]HRQ14223.1 restriction endonuclease [Promineifilum sp.]